MNDKIINLISEINNFDIYYEMSDYNVIYDNYNKKEKSIKNELKNINNYERNYIINSLNENGKLVFERYFN